MHKQKARAMIFFYLSQTSAGGRRQNENQRKFNHNSETTICALQSRFRPEQYLSQFQCSWRSDNSRSTGRRGSRQCYENESKPNESLSVTAPVKGALAS